LERLDGLDRPGAGGGHAGVSIPPTTISSINDSSSLKSPSHGRSEVVVKAARVDRIAVAETFRFLGFTFICGESRQGHFQLSPSSPIRPTVLRFSQGK
jgi:hypothetical protein